MPQESQLQEPGARFAASCVAVVREAHETGRAVALRFATEGAGVIIIDEGSAAVTRTSAEAEKLGVKSLGVDTDFGAPADASAIAARCADSGFVADVLINAQNSATWGSVVDGDLSPWERTIQVNLTGPYAWTRASSRNPSSPAMEEECLPVIFLAG